MTARNTFHCEMESRDRLETFAACSSKVTAPRTQTLQIIVILICSLSVAAGERQSKVAPDESQATGAARRPPPVRRLHA